MRIHDLRAPMGAKKDPKRIGRGKGSGHGGTATRGHKGQKSRTGASIPASFEGGQMPLVRRIPKRGFNNARFAKAYQYINVSALEGRFEPGSTVGPEQMREAGLIGDAFTPVKVLGNGEMTIPLTVKAHMFSASAKSKIESAGGRAEVI
ncbi:MAG TPA: 50S ribosomal protein L15 [Acetomicrobium flavidum]|uniref:Large ribosomal subunit protein uL15 n=2 Tax=Acetomicrobium TaxID=49894 RepID=I4BV40_ACEMN|nr:50S ribosomal protein L15 [Acetomicrobium mobile]SIN64498.1 LSU ribosomal protein L15P [Acetomicrobium flavidum]AFM21147.1 LSU ribosomal protein L15P [Acetomicrobium mobile DSM 13181]HOJ82371.1 50S ribosomal protein L15 [Acetomicrobium flavidum]HPP14391.1 50S ribosomal protein L15 [Acetomicrobium flavidum]HPU69048.1 50S ribosomal protein L15 [Acetomicrobium flavidum]